MFKKNFRIEKQLTTKQLTTNQVEDTVTLAGDLVAPGWERWHCGAVRKLGVQKYIEIASMAREGKQPGKLFSHLLKEHYGK